MIDLPDELWIRIFDIAADEDVIFTPWAPTNLAECAWFKNVFNEWALRTPQEALIHLQRRSYQTKKAIMRTCRKWRRLGAEFLYRSLFFNDPNKLHSLHRAMNMPQNAKLGWWTRRLHLTKYYASTSRQTTMDDMENTLLSIIRRCPNLEIFMIDWPMGEIFGPVAHALANSVSSSLRVLHCVLPSEALSKVIWALPSFPHLLSLHLEFQTPKPASQIKELISLGSASNLQITLLSLQQLSLRGHFQQFVEQAVTGWDLPSLLSVTFDCGSTSTDQPDTLAFIKKYGSKLNFLDLYCIPPLDVGQILNVCPELSTFAFNADWKLEGGALLTPSQLTMNVMAHPKISTIGLHGLLYAFEVGYAAEYMKSEPIHGRVIQRSNDLNVGALNRINFPNLRRIRVLNRSVLTDLNNAGRPGSEGALKRWQTWFDTTLAANIRLEDCTGNLLGNLPDNGYEGEEEEEEEEDESENEESEEYSEGEYEDDWEGPEPAENQGYDVSELRKLVEEVREMAAGREDNPMFSGPALTINGGYGPI